MKKFLLSFLCFLLAVAGGYAEEVTATLSFASKNQRTFYSEEKQVWEQNDVILTNEVTASSNAVADYANPARFYKNSKITITAPGNISKIVFTCSGTSYATALNNSISGSTVSGSVVTVTTTGTSDTYVIESLSGGQVRMKSLTVTYTTSSGGGETPEPEEPEALNAPTLTASCSFDAAMNVEITNIPEGAIVYYTTDGSAPSASDGREYTAPFEITETTTVNAIAVKGELVSEVVSATYTKNGVTESPDPEEPETPGDIEVSFTASNGGYSNQQAIESIQMDNYITVIFDKGTNSNPPKYYTSGAAIRCYGGNTFTISSTAGNITQIVLTYGSSDGSNSINTNVGTFTTTTNTWTGSSQSVIFTIGGTSGNRRIAKISVTYEGTNSGTPDVENVEAPVISCEKEEYIVGEEAVVTITTATEDATIYYSLDGSDPTTEYTSAITLYETTTIKAIAKKEGANNSPLTEKTIVFKEVVKLVNATVAEAIAAYKSGKTITANASIVGYIVGAADGSLNKDGNFSGTTEVETNLLIADDPNETNVENCMPVELPKGEIRNALNLADNPGNYKKQIVLTGSVMAYFSVAGLKNTSAYEFTENIWGSLYYPTAVEIPASVKAYIVTAANNSYVTLTQVTGVLPAETGIIYNGKWSEYATTMSEGANVEGNLLKGSSSNTYVEEEAYVLAKVDGEVGFYKAAMNQLDGTAFLNNANKAYLPVSALPASVQNAKALKFNFDTTGVVGVKVETAGKKVIYDLFGRRVNEMAQPGIYIVNGKKVMVK